MNHTSIEHAVETLTTAESSIEVVCDAAYYVMSSPDIRALGALLWRLTQIHDPYWVRKELVIALGVLGAREGANVLLDIYSSPAEHRDVRAPAAIALGHLGERRAVEPLLKTLRDKDMDLAYAAIAALGEIGDPEAIDSLIEYLQAQDVLVPQAAAEALAQFGPVARKALPELRKLVRNGAEVQRRFALQAISSIEKR